MQVSAEKPKMMTINPTGISRDIKIDDTNLETVDKFKYLGAILSDQGFKPEIVARIAQAVAAFIKIRPLWSDKEISLKSKLRLLRSLVISLFLYACESWTLTKDPEHRIQALKCLEKPEMRCYRKILNISYRDRIRNDFIRDQITNAIGPHEDLLTIVRKRKLKWFGHVVRSVGMDFYASDGIRKEASRSR